MRKRTSAAVPLDEIWQRDEGTCQDCGRLLYQRVVVDERKEVLEDALASLVPQLPVYRWQMDCWQCKVPTPVVTYYLEADQSYTIGDLGKLDRILMARYPLVRRQFSHTMGESVVANSCADCGALQGNWYIMEDLLELLVDQAGMEGMVDCWIPNPLTLGDLQVSKEDLRGPEEVIIHIPHLGHVHHKDRNPENNAPANLVLLCASCHRKAHAGVSAT